MSPLSISVVTWLRRLMWAFAWELHALPVSDTERMLLEKKEIQDESLHRLAAWRRSVLVVILIPTLLAALLHSIALVLQGRQDLSLIGHLLSFANALILWGVPITGGLALWNWTKLARSQRILRLGWMITFTLPFLIALVPYELRLNTVEKLHHDPMVQRELFLVNLLHGLHMMVLLLPTALAILPGVVRACLRIKTLLPASILPGWLLVMAPPFYLLLMVIALIALTQVAESPLLLLGMLCFTGSSMIYVLRADLLVKPLDADGCRQIARVHFWVLLTSLMGIGLLIYYGMTQEIAGLKLFGIQSQTSLLWLHENRAALHLQLGEALSHANSIFSLSDIRFSQIIVQYCGQSLFMTVVFADALVRMSLSLWSNGKRFETSPAAASYDKTMSNLQQALSLEKAVN